MFFFCGKRSPRGEHSPEGSSEKHNTHTSHKPPPPANARTFPIFIQFLCNNTKNHNQRNNNNKRLTNAGRNTTDFCVPPGGGRFYLRNNIPPGLTQRYGIGEMYRTLIKVGIREDSPQPEFRLISSRCCPLRNPLSGEPPSSSRS